MKKVLLVLNEMTYTGAPFAVFLAAKVLKKNGYQVSVATLQNGPFSIEFNNIGVETKLLNENNLKKYLDFFKSFDLVIANTIMNYRVFMFVRRYVPAIFYIMEAEQWTSYCKDNKLNNLLKTSKFIYCVSQYAQNWLKREFKTNASILHNAVSDIFDGQRTYKYNNKINFLLMGTIYPAKGFHIALEAIQNLSQEYQQKIHVRLAGKIFEHNKEYKSKILSQIQSIPCVEYLGEITNLEEKISLYKNTDIVIVPSLDESCSLVALEGAMMGCMLILTDHVGAKYIVEDNNGFIINKNNPEDLTNVIKKIIDEKIDIEEMGKYSRLQYLKTSTEEIYEKNFIKMVNDNIGKSSYYDILCYHFANLKDKIFSIYRYQNHIILTILCIKLKLRIRKNS